MTGPHRLDGRGGEFGALPAAQELQEDRDPIVGGLALVDGKMIGERSGGNSDPISAGETGRLGQFDQAVTLAGANLVMT